MKQQRQQQSPTGNNTTVSLVLMRKTPVSVWMVLLRLTVVVSILALTAESSVGTVQKKGLVTGGAGFVGSHVVLVRGDDIVIVDEKQQRNFTNAVYYRGDVYNKTLMHHIFEQEQPNQICHLAVRIGEQASIQDPSS
jgi:hypothetical protein